MTMVSNWGLSHSKSKVPSLSSGPHSSVKKITCSCNSLMHLHLFNFMLVMHILFYRMYKWPSSVWVHQVFSHVILQEVHLFNATDLTLKSSHLSNTTDLALKSSHPPMSRGGWRLFTLSLGTVHMDGLLYTELSHTSTLQYDTELKI